MLGTVLEKLQSLLSKSFLIASFIPVLIATAVNALLLHTQSGAFQTIVTNYLSTDQDAFEYAGTAAAVLIGISVVAFVVSMLNTRAREIFEGRYWPRLVAAPFVWRQTSRRDAITRRYNDAQSERRLIDRNRERWQAALRAARIKDKPANAQCEYRRRHPVATQWRRLRLRRQFGWPISNTQFQAAVDGLTRVLDVAPVDRPRDEDKDAAQRINDDQVSLKALTEYAHSRNSNDIYWLSGEVQFSFPGEALAPTAMGNVAQSIPHYAYTRYGMNIDLFWTRLQKVMQADAFYAVLQDAKTQLDFLVTLLWLTIATVAVWLPILAWRADDLDIYLLVALLGPVCAVGLYSVAVQNYRAFADLVRSAVDLYRLDLLKALNVARPATATAESELWAALNRRMSYANPANITYDAVKS
jgi:hypothetical protein